jgi:hypothetical protein
VKFKLTALLLALTVASWAQTTTQTPPAPAPQEKAAPQAKTDCAACCEKMASAKEGQSCCRHEMAGKDDKAMSCCKGENASACCEGKDKEAKSCMKGDKDKATAACGDCCKDHEKGCCSQKKDDKTSMNCCGDKQCGEHCASHASAGGK